jgi:hypothetical protein
MDELDLILEESVGPARFGQTPAQVVSVMNEGELYEDWMGGNLNDSLLFRGLVLGFDRCDARGPLPESRLVEARVKGRPGARIFGKRVDAWTRQDLLKFLRQQGYDVRDSPPDVNVPSIGLGLSFDEQGILDYVEIWKPLTLVQRFLRELKRILGKS